MNLIMNQGLHGRDKHKLFLGQFRKFPELENIYNNINDYTDEDIAALPYRKWIKKELTHTRDLARDHIANGKALDRATQIAAIMRAKSEQKS